MGCYRRLSTTRWALPCERGMPPSSRTTTLLEIPTMVLPRFPLRTTSKRMHFQHRIQLVASVCLQGRVAFLAFARVSLKSLIPKSYSFVPISVGDHIRKRRLELGLLQKEAARQLGVNPWTVLNWERGHTEPPVSAMPDIFQFLG